MNPAQTDPPPSEPPLPPAASRARPVTGRAMRLWIGAGLLLLLVALVFWIQQRSGRTERELARRAQLAETRVSQTELQLKALSDAMRELQNKSAVLEARLSESLSQQAQMRQLYDQVAQARGEAVLAEVESSVSLAAQQLQLSGNVQSALIALQEADRSLSRSSLPDSVGLRRVLARDIERLKALPVADFATAVNRLDALIALTDQLPLRADVQPALATPGAPDPEATTPGLRGLPERMARTGTQGWQTFVAELRQLVRVQRVDEPEAFLLSPSQRIFARENLRLMLLNARLNLLSRNETLFQSDLARSVQLMERYFDANARSVATAVSALRQMGSGAVSLQVPTLGDTLTAVRTARSAGEGR
jgi:uroporphyrin-3 C-methyltransferase